MKHPAPPPAPRTLRVAAEAGWSSRVSFTALVAIFAALSTVAGCGAGDPRLLPPGGNLEAFLEDAVRASLGLRARILEEEAGTRAIDLLERLASRFAGEAPRIFSGMRSLEGFHLPPGTIAGAVEAGAGAALAPRAFAAFAGKWYGLWAGRPVDHLWGPYVSCDPPRPIAWNAAQARLLGYQCAWVGDGYGVNLFVELEEEGRSVPLALGYVVHFSPEAGGRAVARRPHVAVVIDAHRIIWITAGELFLEELYKEGEEVRYAISGFRYRISPPGAAEAYEAFHVTYGRDAARRRPWIGRAVGLRVEAAPPSGKSEAKP